MIRLLLVDDNPTIRALTKLHFSNHPFIKLVGTCKDGNEVIPFLRDCYANVILMDIKMKTINGIEATEIVKKAYPEIKIYGYSSENCTTMKAKMMSAGAIACFSKNMNLDEISKLILK